MLVTGNPSHTMLMLDGLPPPPYTTYPTSAASSVSVSIESLGALGAQPAGRRVLSSTI